MQLFLIHRKNVEPLNYSVLPWNAQYMQRCPRGGTVWHKREIWHQHRRGVDWERTCHPPRMEKLPEGHDWPVTVLWWQRVPRTWRDGPGGQWVRGKFGDLHDHTGLIEGGVGVFFLWTQVFLNIIYYLALYPDNVVLLTFVLRLLLSQEKRGNLRFRMII